MLSRLERTAIALESAEVQELKEIVMDRDAAKALVFLTEVVDRKVQQVWAETYAHEELSAKTSHPDPTHVRGAGTEGEAERPGATV